MKIAIRLSQWNSYCQRQRRKKTPMEHIHTHTHNADTRQIQIESVDDDEIADYASD